MFKWDELTAAQKVIMLNAKSFGMIVLYGEDELTTGAYLRDKGLLFQTGHKFSGEYSEASSKNEWGLTDAGRKLMNSYDALVTANAPAQPAPGGGADAVYDVQCRCGYMASQHWADGECPGDGYPYDDAPENHLTPELPYERFMEILREVLHFPQDEAMFSEWAVIEAIRQDNAALMTRDAEVERLQQQLADANARAAALERALEPFAHEWQVYQDFAAEQGGRADVGNYLTNYRDLDIIMDACERAYKARQTAGE